MRVASDMADHGDPEGFSRVLKAGGRSPFRVGLIFGSLVMVAIALLIIQNGESAQIDWLAFDFKAPLWIILFVTLISGAIVWELIKVAWQRGRRLRRERRGALAFTKAMDS
jgi:uncharacterized integral membrane protein